MRIVLIVLQWTGIVFIGHALMLLGADEITTLEKGHVLTVRSLEQILTLYGADPTVIPALGGISTVVLGWPAWAILAVSGSIIWWISRYLESV